MAAPSVDYCGPDFTRDMRSRWEHRPAVERPLTYDIAVEDTYLPWRTWLDEQLAELPPDTAATMAGKLWNEDHFWPCVFELAAGAGLRTLGLAVAYERSWAGLTPDWTILSPDNRALCFVEVHTDAPPRQTHAEIRRWHDLARRIRDIPVPVTLVLEASEGRPVPPTSGEAKKIVAGLRKQLFGLGTRDRVSSWGYTFRRLPVPTPGLRARFAPPSAIAGVVSPRDMMTKVNQKASKYRHLADSHDVPFVVAVGADTFTGLNLDVVDDLLAGKPHSLLQFNIGDQYIGGAEIDLAHPSKWEMPRTLSGLLWISNKLPFNLEGWRPNSLARWTAPAPFNALLGS